VAQRALHRLHAFDARLQVVDVALRQRLDLGAGARAVAPQRQQAGDLLQPEAEVARAG
jgi:hypothetical protein